MRLALRILASIVLGLMLLIPLGAIYGLAGLPVYHSWGLIHGSVTTAIPALIVSSFVCLGLVPSFGPTIDIPPRIIASLSVFPLVTVLFWVGQYTNVALFSFWHAVTYVVVSGMLTILCLNSQKPLLIPFFLFVPVLIDPIFGLLITGVSDVGIEIFSEHFHSQVLPVLLSSGAALALTYCINARRV